VNRELLQLFFTETSEIIEAMEAGLLALEKNPGDRDQLHSVFRAAHTLKGNAATVGGLDRLVEFAHIQENVLDMIRHGRLALTDEVMSALLASVDALKAGFKRLLAGQTYQEFLEPVKASLMNLDPETEGGGWERSSRPVASAPPAASTEAGRSLAAESGGFNLQGDRIRFFLPGHAPVQGSFEVPRAQVESALFTDRRIFAFWILEDRLPADWDRLAFRQRMETYALPLGRARQAVQGRSVDLWLVTSVLELPGLMALALELPGDQLFTYSMEDLRAALASSPLIEASPPVPEPYEPRKHHLTRSDLPPSAAVPSDPLKPAETPEALDSIRVNVDLIDRLMNLAGELVLGRNQLTRLLKDSVEQVKGLAGLVQHVNQVTTNIQDRTMQMRMQPLGNVLSRFPRMVMELARTLGKEVELKIEGAEVELDRSILQALSDPMTHLLRNAVDHGLEPPTDRTARNKPPAGRIVIKAFHDEGRVNIAVSDDGRGIDPDRVVEKAIKSGLVDLARARQMSHPEKLSLIFLPGFSTAEAITDVSGRGVGMDVVRTNIERIGGSLEIESLPDQGTTVRLRLPLTLAIIPCLMVRALGQTFAVPQRDVAEMVAVGRDEMARKLLKVGDAPVMRRRDRLLPLIRLADTLRRKPTAGSGGRPRPVPADSADSLPETLFVVVLRLGPHRYGLIVDELLDTEEIVVKPLSEHIQGCRFFSGTTILGDGRVAMILSAVGMAADAGLDFKEFEARERKKAEQAKKSARTEETRALVLFNNATDEFFALALSEVARLEVIAPQAMEKIGGRLYLPYRGGSLRLIRLEDLLPVSPPPSDARELFVLIPRTAGPPVGFLASRIVDTLETNVRVDPDRFTTPGVRGAAVLDGRLVLFLDAERLLGLLDHQNGGYHGGLKPLAHAPAA
jgi:two-component system chemotaxis sensor kinase CheA